MKRPSFALTVLLAALAGPLLTVGSARCQNGLPPHRDRCEVCPLLEEYSSDYIYHCEAEIAEAEFDEHLDPRFDPETGRYVGHDEVKPIEPAVEETAATEEELEDFYTGYDGTYDAEVYGAYAAEATVETVEEANADADRYNEEYYDYAYEEYDYDYEASDYWYETEAVEAEATEEVDNSVAVEEVEETTDVAEEVEETTDVAAEAEVTTEVAEEAEEASDEAEEVAEVSDVAEEEAIEETYDYGYDNYDNYEYETYDYEAYDYEAEATAAEEAPVPPVVDPEVLAAENAAIEESQSAEAWDYEAEGYDPYEYDYEAYEYDYEVYENGAVATPVEADEELTSENEYDVEEDYSYDDYEYDYEYGYDYEADYVYEDEVVEEPAESVAPVMNAVSRQALLTIAGALDSVSGMLKNASQELERTAALESNLR